MSMARLWRDQGKRDEARDLLAPVYGWFSEGFDTLDLQDAIALLDELSCASGPGHPAETSSAGEPQKGYRLFFLMSLISERRFSISLKVEPEIY
jgi:hypothetical protein